MPASSHKTAPPPLRLLESDAADPPGDPGGVVVPVRVVEDEHLRTPAAAEEGLGLEGGAEELPGLADETVHAVPVGPPERVGRLDARAVLESPRLLGLGLLGGLAAAPRLVPDLVLHLEVGPLREVHDEVPDGGIVRRLRPDVDGAEDPCLGEMVPALGQVVGPDQVARLQGDRPVHDAGARPSRLRLPDRAHGGPGAGVDLEAHREPPGDGVQDPGQARLRVALIPEPGRQDAAVVHVGVDPERLADAQVQLGRRGALEAQHLLGKLEAHERGALALFYGDGDPKPAGLEESKTSRGRPTSSER